MLLSDVTKLETSEIVKEIEQIYHSCIPMYPSGTQRDSHSRMLNLLREMRDRALAVPSHLVGDSKSSDGVGDY